MRFHLILCPSLAQRRASLFAGTPLV